MVSKVGEITPEILRSFSETFLVKNYDGSLDVPNVHLEWWDMCLSKHRLVSIAAPRGHAKSTSITLAYTLASLMFRKKKYAIIVGNNEDTASELLGILRTELQENELLRDVFGITSLPKDLATEIRVRFEDGHQFRIIAKGAGQKVRGRQWRGTRPDLIVIDDLEDDEMVESDTRRAKIKGWVLKALMPAMSRVNGQIRMIGTILHDDGVLMTTIKSKAWHSALYKAHKSFDDFSDILWPEMYEEEALREVRQTFIDTGDAEGYSQEYLNDPSDLRNAFFRVVDMLPMEDVDHNREKAFYVGCDFALSDKNYSDYSVMVVGGYDSEGTLHIVDEHRVRTEDVNVIVSMLFDVLELWNPEYFIWEKGLLDNAIRPAFYEEMVRRNKFAQIQTYPAIGDKRLRAAGIQQRMRAGYVKYDQDAEWFPEHKDELRRFPRGEKKDRVDAMAWLGRGVDEFAEAPTQEELENMEWEDMFDNAGWTQLDYTGTGY